MYEFGIDFVARCIAGEALESMGGLQMRMVTKDQYDNIEHDNSTVYYVVDGDKVVVYFGDAKLGSASTAGITSLESVKVETTIGTATFNNL